MKKIVAVYFSATGTTEKIVKTIALQLSEDLRLPMEVCDFTLPAARKNPLVFDEESLLVFGTPVYAGRVPNLMAKYLVTMRAGKCAAVAVSVYGNRDFDDALVETCDILHHAGAVVVAAAAFIGEHSFSKTLAVGRPDAADIAKAVDFAKKTSEKFKNNVLSEPEPDGVPFPYRQHFQPVNADGEPFDMRKVKPATSADCFSCGLCAEICPMGAIDSSDFSLVNGVCIKCGACVKKCPTHAKSFTDVNYLYHLRDIEYKNRNRKEPKMFL